jgi:excisionase family DNA binding protein
MNAAQAGTRTSIADQGFATIDEAAHFLGLKRSSVYKLMELQELTFAKFGKSRRIPWKAIRSYAERCLIGNAS